MRIVKWVEPEIGREAPVTRTLTEPEAIERQREQGRRHNYEYETDAEALADFLSVHWATITRED